MKLEVNKNHKKIDLNNIKTRAVRFILGGLISVSLFSGLGKNTSNILTKEQQITEQSTTIYDGEKEIPIIKEDNGETLVFVGNGIRRLFSNPICDGQDNNFIYENMDSEGYVSVDKLKNIKSLSIYVRSYPSLEWLNYCENLESAYFKIDKNTDCSMLNCLEGWDNLHTVYLGDESVLYKSGVSTRMIYDGNDILYYPIESVIQKDNILFASHCPKLENFVIQGCVDMNILRYLYSELSENISFSDCKVTSMCIYAGSINTNVKLKICYNNNKEIRIIAYDVKESISKELKEKLELEIIEFINNIVIEKSTELHLTCPTGEYKNKAYFTLDSFNSINAEKTNFKLYDKIKISPNRGNICREDFNLLNQFPCLEQKEICLENAYDIEIVNNISWDNISFPLSDFLEASYQDKVLYESFIKKLENGATVNMEPILVYSVDLLSILSLEQIIYLRDNGILAIDEEMFNKMLEIENKLQNIIKNFNLTEDSSDLEKFNAIKKYVCDNAYYIIDDSNGEWNYGWLPRIMDYGRGQCCNYAILTTALANRLGLECYNVDSFIHAWNLIKIDSKYYYTDLTSVDSGSLEWELIPAEQDIGGYAPDPHQIGNEIVLPNDLQFNQFIDENNNINNNDYNNMWRYFIIGGFMTYGIGELMDSYNKKTRKKLQFTSDYKSK